MITLTRDLVPGLSDADNGRVIPWPIGVVKGVPVIWIEAGLVLRLAAEMFSWPITVVNQGTKTFTVAGDQTAHVLAGQRVDVTGSTGNDGTYAVVSVALFSGDTRIVVASAIPNSTADGTLHVPGAGMALGVTDPEGVITRLPASGTVQIDSERITYSLVDVSRLVLILTARGAGGSQETGHAKDAAVYSTAGDFVGIFSETPGNHQALSVDAIYLDGVVKLPADPPVHTINLSDGSILAGVSLVSITFDMSTIRPAPTTRPPGPEAPRPVAVVAFGITTLPPAPPKPPPVNANTVVAPAPPQPTGPMFPVGVGGPLA
ncbi:MAG: hypothetical protein ACREMG_00290, partial [Gemmatimonadales bacterium]